MSALHQKRLHLCIDCAAWWWGHWWEGGHAPRPEHDHMVVMPSHIALHEDGGLTAEFPNPKPYVTGGAPMGLGGYFG